MRFVADTITEYYEHIGELRGEERGRLLARIEVARKQLEQFDNLLQVGVLTQQAYSLLAPPLRQKLAETETDFQVLFPDRKLLT